MTYRLCVKYTYKDRYDMQTVCKVHIQDRYDMRTVCKVHIQRQV